jgi:hypothetical protein
MVLPGVYALEIGVRQPVPESLDRSSFRRIELVADTLVLSGPGGNRGQAERSTVLRITDSGKAPMDTTLTRRGSFSSSDDGLIIRVGSPCIYFETFNVREDGQLLVTQSAGSEGSCPANLGVLPIHRFRRVNPQNITP